MMNQKGEQNFKSRIFIGIPLKEEIRKEIQKQLHNLPGRSVPSEHWHFTLHFLGPLAEIQIQQLDHCLREINFGHSFKSSIAHFNAFPNLRSARVVWLGIGDGIASFTRLAQSLTEALRGQEFKLEDRDYIPHLTLSRLSKPCNLNRWIKQNPFKKIPFQVEEIVVFRSVFPQTGGPPHYEKLFHYPLKNSD